MGGKCNCFNPSKVNGKCVYKGKLRKNCSIYEVSFTMCDAMYIVNPQQKPKKIMDGHLYDIQLIIKNGQKSYSFAVHYEKHFEYSTSHTDLRKCMKLKVVKQIKTIGSIKSLMKTN